MRRFAAGQAGTRRPEAVIYRALSSTSARRQRFVRLSGRLTFASDGREREATFDERREVLLQGAPDLSEQDDDES